MWLRTPDTYLNSSLTSLTDASKGTFLTKILELVCLLDVAFVRPPTAALKTSRQNCLLDANRRISKIWEKALSEHNKRIKEKND